jgi:hypothetical protein
VDQPDQEDQTVGRVDPLVVAADLDPVLQWATLVMVLPPPITIVILITEEAAVEGDRPLTMAQAAGTIIRITEEVNGITMAAEEAVAAKAITHIDPPLRHHDQDMQVQHLQVILDIVADPLLGDTLHHTMDHPHINHPRLTINFASLMHILLRHQLGDPFHFSRRATPLQPPQPLLGLQPQGQEVLHPLEPQYQHHRG